MSGEFLIKYNDIFKVEQKYKNNLKDLMTQIDACSQAISSFINDETYSGETALAVKNYLSDVHITLLASLKVIAQTMLDNMALYKASYYTIDQSTNFILSEVIMKGYDTALDAHLENVEQSKSQANTAINSLAEIFPIEKPSIDAILSSHKTIGDKIDNLIEDVDTIESQTVTALESSVVQLLEYLRKSIAAAGSDYIGVTTYQSGSYYTNKNVYALACLSEEFFQQHQQNADAYDEIWKTEEDLATAADERATEGIWKTAGGVLLIVGGAAAIFFTAGAATPIVVAGAAAGGGTIIFGIADASEGAQEIYYGKAGDTSSVSVNALRDSIIFNENEQAYQITESVFAFTASAMVPLGQASTVGSLTFRSGTVTTVKMGISQVASQYTSVKVTEATGSKAAGLLAGMAVGYGTSSSLNALDNKLNFSGLPSSTAEAQSFQGAGKYPGVDDYQDVIVKKGTVLYRGEPNGTEYFTTIDAIEQSGMSKQTLFEGLQVEAHPIYGYRSEMQGYIFNKNVAGAYGIVDANPQFGIGGLEQYYIPNVSAWIEKGILTPVDSIKLH